MQLTVPDRVKLAASLCDPGEYGVLLASATEKAVEVASDDDIGFTRLNSFDGWSESWSVF